VAQYQESAGRLTQEYRKRIDLLEDTPVPTTPEMLAESPDVVQQRRRRYVVELELRLTSLHVERDALYAERQAHRINDESLRSLVSELDLQEVPLRRRLGIARRAADVQAPPGNSH
jgi:CPA1 family monovalent cation:H+ antiporter